MLTMDLGDDHAWVDHGVDHGVGVLYYYIIMHTYHAWTLCPACASPHLHSAHVVP